MTDSDPKWLIEEVSRIKSRRNALCQPSLGQQQVSGLALSGGGIRSATFSLGLLRAIGRAGLIPKIDYLSTVSGGSYAGTLLCSLYVPQSRRGEAPVDPRCQQPESANEAAEMSAMRAADYDPFSGAKGAFALLHLRNSGRHLLPGGVGDTIRIAAIMLRNWLAIHLVIGVTLLTVFVFLELIQITLLSWVTLLDWEAANLAAYSEVTWPSFWLQGAHIGPEIVGSWLFPLALYPLACEIAVASGFWFTSHGKRFGRNGIPPGLCSAPGLTAVLVGMLAIYLTRQGFSHDNTGQIASLLGFVMVIASFGGIVTYLLAHLDAWTLSKQNDCKRWLRPVRWLKLTLACAAILILARQTFFPGDGRTRIIIATAGGCVICCAAAAVLIKRLKKIEGEEKKKASDKCDQSKKAQTQSAALIREQRVRSILTDTLTRWFRWAVVLVVTGLFDTVAQSLYIRKAELLHVGLGGGLSMAAVVPLARWAIKVLGGAGEGTTLGNWTRTFARFGHLIALAAGLLLATAVGLLWAVVAHAIVWHGRPVGWSDQLGDGYAALVVICCFLLAIAITMSRARSFVNLSSLSAFYTGRLRRAYLGASNAQRSKLGERRVDPDDTTADDFTQDDIEVSEKGYYANDVLAPLHLINITINDTASGSSNLTRQDRHGKPLVISPAGILYAVQLKCKEDAVSKLTKPVNSIQFERVQFDCAQAQALPLSNWVGISGAAFSTGTGRYTSTGLSLLAGLTNLRLGAWWDSSAQNRWLKDSVQNLLRRELTGMFQGTDSGQWYLSDGGHFDNTGAYQLIRRKVPFIVLADCGADPGYAFSDVVQLVRLVRIDMEVEIDFLDSSELDHYLGEENPLRSLFGSLTELGAGLNESDRRIGPYAALAHLYDVSEPNEIWGTLLLIKPRLCGREMPDLVAYMKENPKFPQQSTADQFFDEAQWESYYRLGELIGGRLFLPASTQKWQPHSLSRLREVTGAIT